MRETNTLPAELRDLVSGRRKPGPPGTISDRLDPFLRDARAGVPDDLIAKNAGVTARAVRRWRQSHGIKSGVADAAAKAADAFGTGIRDVMHRAASSPVGGCFEVPEYVLRVPLQYESFARHAHAMHTVLGSTAADLAAALGLREQDAAMAVALWQAHLERAGVLCCGELHDPRFGCLRCR